MPMGAKACCIQATFQNLHRNDDVIKNGINNKDTENTANAKITKP